MEAKGRRVQSVSRMRGDFLVLLSSHATRVSRSPRFPLYSPKIHKKFAYSAGWHNPVTWYKISYAWTQVTWALSITSPWKIATGQKLKPRFFRVFNRDGFNFCPVAIFHSEVKNILWLIKEKMSFWLLIWQIKNKLQNDKIYKLCKKGKIKINIFW